MTWVLAKVPQFRRSHPNSLHKWNKKVYHQNVWQCWQKQTAYLPKATIQHMNCWIKKCHSMGWSLAGNLSFCLVEKTRKVVQKFRWIVAYLFQFSVSSKEVRFYRLQIKWKYFISQHEEENKIQKNLNGIFLSLWRFFHNIFHWPPPTPANS